MIRTKILAIITATILVAGLVAFIPPEQAEAKKDDLLKSNIVGISVPGMMVDGVPGSGVTWTVSDGEATLDKNGKLHVKVKGLLVSDPFHPCFGTICGKTTVWIGLTCEGVSGTVFTTPGAPLKSNGDAKIKFTIPLPSTCIGPTILIQLGGMSTSPWIAATGF